MSSRPVRKAVQNAKPVQYHISLPGDDDYDFDEYFASNDTEKGGDCKTVQVPDTTDGGQMDVEKNGEQVSQSIEEPITHSMVATKSSSWETSKFRGRGPTRSPSEESDDDYFQPEAAVKEEEPDQGQPDDLDDEGPVNMTSTSTSKYKASAKPKSKTSVTKKSPKVKRERSTVAGAGSDSDSPSSKRQRQPTSTNRFKPSGIIRLAFGDSYINNKKLDFKSIAALTGDDPEKVCKVRVCKVSFHPAMHTDARMHV